MSVETNTDIRPLWTKGLPHEAGFWAEWVASKGSQWLVDFKKRINPTYELQARIREMIAAPEGATVRIPDVGAGPMTPLGNV